jgi:hypothetical protein
LPWKPGTAGFRHFFAAVIAPQMPEADPKTLWRYPQNAVRVFGC